MNDDRMNMHEKNINSSEVIRIYQNSKHFPVCVYALEKYNIRPPSHHCHAILSHKGAMAFVLPLLPEENHLGQSDQSYVLLKFWAWMETLQEPHLPIPMASLA